MTTIFSQLFVPLGKGGKIKKNLLDVGLGSIAGVMSSQALPGFLITAPPSVCVPDVIASCALAVWIQNPKKKKKVPGASRRLLMYKSFDFSRLRVNKLGYPLSVFNKNSTLKDVVSCTHTGNNFASSTVTKRVEDTCAAR